MGAERDAVAPKRNCWTCRFNVEDVCGFVCVEPSYSVAVGLDPIARWLSATVPFDDKNMPPRESDGCPGYQPFDLLDPDNVKLDAAGDQP